MKAINSSLLKETGEKAVKQLILQLNNDKAFSPINVPAFIRKENVNILSSPLSHIIHFKDRQYLEFLIAAVHIKNDTHLCHCSTEHTLIVNFMFVVFLQICKSFDYEINTKKTIFFYIRVPIRHKNCLM